MYNRDNVKYIHDWILGTIVDSFNEQTGTEHNTEDFSIRPLPESPIAKHKSFILEHKDGLKLHVYCKRNKHNHISKFSYMESINDELNVPDGMWVAKFDMDSSWFDALYHWVDDDDVFGNNQCENALDVDYIAMEMNGSPLLMEDGSWLLLETA